MLRDPGAHRLDEGHELALVVGRAAGADHRAGLGLFQLRFEGGAVPQLQRVDRLDVIMAVEQQVRRAFAPMGDHHRMAGGRAFGGVEPDCLEVVHQPVGGGVAIALVGGVGRDRGDAQERQEALQRGFLVGVEAGENGGEFHAILLLIGGKRIIASAAVQTGWRCRKRLGMLR